jgi:hypothetical protein
MYCESISIIVQQDVTICSLLYFCELLALHVLGGNSTHHQEYITVITASGTGQTASATFRCCGVFETAVTNAPQLYVPLMMGGVTTRNM